MINKKKCQIHARYPITCFEVPIVGFTELNLTSEEIYKCLCAKAEITEVLPDGKLVNLDFTNYDKDNYEIKPKEEIVETVQKIKEPVEDKEEVEEDKTLENNKEEQPVETSSDSLVKTHEVHSRSTTYQKSSNNYKKGKNKNYKR